MNFNAKSLRQAAVLSALLGASAVWAGGPAFMPAAGEFSAVDQVELAPSQGMTRATARIEAANDPQAAHKLNNETLQNHHAEATRTRTEVRQEGRLAMRAGEIASGEISF